MGVTTESGLHSYSKIFHLGHKALENLFKNPVRVEEKVDGSQFSFGKRDGQMYYRSRGSQIYAGTTDKLFKGAVDYIESVKTVVVEGVTYRGEVLHAPRHNTLTYGRVPKNNVVIFDVEFDGQSFATAAERAAYADALGFETVPVVFEGIVDNIEQLKEFLNRESYLGGCKLEGIVIKNYEQFGEDKKVLMGKWVREEFKEIHQGAWKAANPSKTDIIEAMIAVYRNDNRYQKAVQHLAEKGELTNSPQDIGKLMAEFQKDLLEECGAEIKEKLFELAWHKIARGASGNIPNWYKTKLAESQFKETV